MLKLLNQCRVGCENLSHAYFIPFQEWNVVEDWLVKYAQGWVGLDVVKNAKVSSVEHSCKEGKTSFVPLIALIGFDWFCR